MTDRDLFRVRIALIQAVLRRENLDGVLLNRVDNFAMATGGKRNFIYTAADAGVCALFVHRDGRAFYVGNTIEVDRLFEEELEGLDCDRITYRWFEQSPAQAVERALTGRFASDDGSLGPNIHGALARARALLTLDELDRYRALGALAAECMMATLDSIERGMREADIAARLIAEGAKRRCQVPVALVAADERVAKHRHPLPTVAPLRGEGLHEKRVHQYVMVVGCFLREGLVVSTTRFKQVDTLAEPLHRLYDHICGVDAIMQEATQPGQTLGDVFETCQNAYVAMGFPENEWHNHHQGGATGYAGRTCKGTPGETFPVLDAALAREACEILGQDVAFGSAFAWNPSGVGVKSEDTFILLPDGSQEIVSATPALPSVDLEAILGRPTGVVKSAIAQ